MPDIKLRAIVVDDEENIRKLHEQRIPKWQTNVTIVATCANAEEALLAIVKHKPDLLFLDIFMPGMDGLEFFKYAAALNVPLQCIIVTAFPDAAYFQEAIRLGLTDYLLKPLRKEELQRAMENVIHRMESGRHAGQIRELSHHLQHAAIVLPITDGVIRVRPEQILYAAANGKYSELYFTHQHKETIMLGISELEEKIKSDTITRIDRFMLLNMQHVEKVHLKFQKVYFRTEKNVSEIEVSRTGVEKAFEMMRG